MDPGSLDKLVTFTYGETVPALHPESEDDLELVWQGVPEDVLARMAGSMVKGLKFLKDELGVIHRGISFVLLFSRLLNTHFRRQTYQRSH